MINLREKQDLLDEKKYRSSILARCDMSGKMEYCKGCIFRNDRHECDIPHEIRKDYQVCVRQFYKIEEEKNNEPIKLTIKSGKTRKRSDG